MLSFELEPERQETVAAYWRRHHQWLASKGYVLRTALRASWTPSGDLDLDPRYLQRGVVIDATRASDGMHVALKRVCLDRASAEVDLAHYFHALNGKSLRNHCCPILDILPVDGSEKDVILVMPLLKEFDEPRFKTFGEVVAFLSQIFEGLEFLHDTVNITHGECVSRHIMMDASPLYEHPYDPSFPALRRDWSGPSKPHSRTSRPVRYYFVDFGHAKSTLAKADTAEVQELRAADIYELGNTIRKVFFNQYDGFEFLYPVLADMMQVDPSHRPSARTLFRRFLNVRDSLSESKLRARLIHRDGEPLLRRIGNDVSHFLVTAKRSLVGVPAIPDA